MPHLVFEQSCDVLDVSGTCAPPNPVNEQSDQEGIALSRQKNGETPLARCSTQLSLNSPSLIDSDGQRGALPGNQTVRLLSADLPGARKAATRRDEPRPDKARRAVTTGKSRGERRIEQR